MKTYDSSKLKWETDTNLNTNTIPENSGTTNGQVTSAINCITVITQVRTDCVFSFLLHFFTIFWMKTSNGFGWRPGNVSIMNTLSMNNHRQCIHGSMTLLHGLFQSKCVILTWVWVVLLECFEPRHTPQWHETTTSTSCWYLFLDTGYLILDTQFLILNTRYLILDTKYSILDT